MEVEAGNMQGKVEGKITARGSGGGGERGRWKWSQEVTLKGSGGGGTFRGKWRERSRKEEVEGGRTW